MADHAVKLPAAAKRVKIAVEPGGVEPSNTEVSEHPQQVKRTYTPVRIAE